MLGLQNLKHHRTRNFVDAKVVSKDESADKRTVEFKVDDLSKPAAVKIHVVVPNAKL